MAPGSGDFFRMDTSRSPVLSRLLEVFSSAWTQKENGIPVPFTTGAVRSSQSESCPTRAAKIQGAYPQTRGERSLALLSSACEPLPDRSFSLQLATDLKRNNTRFATTGCR